MKHSKLFLTKLATAVIKQGVEDLESEDADLREDAEEFFFDADQSGPLSLENWLLFDGCEDADMFRASLRLKLERKKKKAA